MSLVQQELLSLPEDMSSLPVVSGVRVAESLVLFVVLCRSLFCLYFYVGYCIVCQSIYGFWLPLWYLQTFLHIGNSKITRRFIYVLFFSPNLYLKCCSVVSILGQFALYVWLADKSCGIVLNVNLTLRQVQ